MLHADAGLPATVSRKRSPKLATSNSRIKPFQSAEQVSGKGQGSPSLSTPHALWTLPTEPSTSHPHAPVRAILVANHQARISQHIQHRLAIAHNLAVRRCTHKNTHP
ncbi:hypothetical protein IAS59_000548 [Cryptococcus gattii]